MENVHTAVENPIQESAITERAINAYKNGIVITTEDFTQVKAKRYTRIYVTISKTNVREEQHFVGDYIDPKLKYATFFKVFSKVRVFFKNKY